MLLILEHVDESEPTWQSQLGTLRADPSLFRESSEESASGNRLQNLSDISLFRRRVW